MGSPQLRFCLALVASHHTNAFATAQARRCAQPHRCTYISRHCNRMGGHLHARAKRWTKGVSVVWVSLFVVCLCTSRWHGSYTYLCFQAGCCHIKWSRLLLLGSARCAWMHVECKAAGARVALLARFGPRVRRSGVQPRLRIGYAPVGTECRGGVTGVRALDNVATPFDVPTHTRAVAAECSLGQRP